MNEGLEHNEAKVQDFTIPFFELEQKFEKLEGLFSAFQADGVEIFAEGIAKRMQKDYSKFLPQLNRQMKDLEHFKDRIETQEKLDKLQKEREHLEQMSNKKKDYDITDIQNMQFSINTCKAEIEFIKRLFTPAKLQMIETN